MRWFERALSFVRPKADTTRMSVRPHAQFGVEIPPELREAMTGYGNLAAPISRKEALSVPAVLKARNIIAGTLATLPIRFHYKDGSRKDPTSFLNQIDPDVPNSVTLAQTFEDLLFDSVSWWRITEFGWHGYPTHAKHVPIESVHVSGTGNLPSVAQISPDIPFPADGQVFIDGVPVPDEEIIRFDSPNPPLLVHAARAIRICMRLDQTAARYADEPLPLGYFTDLDGEEPLTKEEAEELLDEWEDARRKRAWQYLGGVKAETLQFNAEQIQLAQQRQHAVLEIARATGIDPEDLGVSTTSRTYANAESRRLALLDFVLAPYVTAVEERLSMRDVVPRDYHARVELNGFLRSDSLTRMQVYRAGLEVGAFTPEEIRELEGKPPLTPSQRTAAQPQSPQPQQAPDDMSQQEPSSQESEAMPATTFSHGEGIKVQFDGPETSATFRVNEQKRTISGLVIPWGKVADNGAGRWRFKENSLYWTDESRVKLNLHHDHTKAFGKAVRLQNTSAGLDATFQVARGPEGDRALQLAQDGVLDGFSVEVYFEDEDSWTYDPADRETRLVSRARLRGVALTAMPAFDDARVSAVAASLDHRKENDMTAETVAHEREPDVTFEAQMAQLTEKIAQSHQNLTKELAESIGESVSAGVKAALENISSPQDQRGTVRAARYTVTREAPIYTFNGLGHSLVRDAWYAAREHDDDAMERIRRYRVQQEEMAKLAAQFVGRAQSFAPITTGGAGEIIPPGYRPDLYVPELSQGRPLTNLCSRGAIQNATPFLVPKFGSATGATADHTEGQDPSDGQLTFAEQTVQPQAISGRYTLSRELADSANPAIDQIALQTMREDYNRRTEQKVYAALNGAAPSGNTATFDESSVITDVRGLLADYPFVRFAAPTGAAMNQKVTRTFATTVGSDGRPLLPSVGAENTAGLGNAVNQGWFIDGLRFVPAWSITDALSDDVVLIVNQSDVWVWESPLLTFRFEEKQGPANIELNVFGYFAVAVLRPAGIFAIRNPAA